MNEGMRLMLSLALLAVLAGCQDLPVSPTAAPGTVSRPSAPITVAASAIPTPRPVASSAAPPPSTQPSPVAKPTVPVSSAILNRSLADRVDDGNGLQLHVLYALSADAEDRQLDTNGAIARSVAAANAWLGQQTGGSKLRLDTVAGALDVTFYRSKKTHAQLGATPDDWHAAIADELQAAGFTKLNKVYAFYYGGGTQSHGAGSRVVGVGGSGYASVLLSQCVDCSLANSDQSVGTEEFTLLHETIHALGFVPKCAPHATDTEHTSDDPTDLMYAESGADDAPPQLDPKRDDYFRNDAVDCADLARSPFMDPLPARLQLPVGRPLALEPGLRPTPFKPALADVVGSPSLEASLLAALNEGRKTAGLPALLPDDGLARLSRQAGLLLGSADLGEVARQVGFAGTCGMEGFTTDVLASDATLLDNFRTSDAYKRLAADATVNGVGLGVTRTAVQAQVVATFARLHLRVAPAPTLGEGLASSYTLAIPVQPLVGGRARAVLDGEEAGAYMLEAGKPQTLYVSVPRKGKHEVRVALESKPGSYLVELSYHVDGDLPLEKAFIP
ncbi:MAG: hypothetical protein JWM80_2879 [Cyanobacteria bacterium RYN_339]|nr:hypothetical protein [Cyanobacteria bacterium RYN_339]